MSSTELAVIGHEELETIQRTAKMLAVSGYFDARGESPVALAQVAVKIMAGREMGFGPFAAVRGIHIINGAPSVSANLMAAAVRNNPRYDYRVREHTDKVCRLEFFIRTESGKWESLGSSDFTAEDAKRAGTKNMDRYPKNMLFARAMSNGVRFFCPDAFSGVAVYTPDELGADVDDNGDVIDVTPTPATAPAPTRTSPSAAPAPSAPQNGAQTPAKVQRPAQPAPVATPQSDDELIPFGAEAEDNPFVFNIAAVGLEGNCAKFAEWGKSKHAQSKDPATRPMYEYLSGVIDTICGNDVHRDVMGVLVGRSVTGDNPPGYDLASSLLDWLPETTGKGDAKVANPNHNAAYVSCIRHIGELVMEARGQKTLGI